MQDYRLSSAVPIEQGGQVTGGVRWISPSEWDQAYKDYYAKKGVKDNVLAFHISVEQLLSRLQEGTSASSADLAQIGVLLSLVLGHIASACEGGYNMKDQLVKAESVLKSLNQHLLSGGQLDSTVQTK